MVHTEITDNGDRDVIGTVGEGMRTAALNWFRIVWIVTGSCVLAAILCCGHCYGEQAGSPNVWID
jgi:hypothetical protein